MKPKGNKTDIMEADGIFLRLFSIRKDSKCVK
jgi:hypothetical protein